MEQKHDLKLISIYSALDFNSSVDLKLVLQDKKKPLEYNDLQNKQTKRLKRIHWYDVFKNNHAVHQKVTRDY